MAKGALLIRAAKQNYTGQLDLLHAAGEPKSFFEFNLMTH